jgi:hypothetical protein
VVLAIHREAARTMTAVRPSLAALSDARAMARGL